MCETFIKEQITTIEARIVALQAAELGLADGAIQEYTLDTGQTIQRVTKVNIATLQKVINGLYNQYATLCARVNGGAINIARPVW